jgi:hypothetical protein
MGYSIFISRQNNEEISIEEWKQAVNSIDGVKLDSDPIVGINPNSKAQTSVACNEGDVAVAFKTGGFLGIGAKIQWQKAIYFSHGCGQFNAAEDIEDPKNPVHIAAAKLSKALAENIRGEAGELYHW